MRIALVAIVARRLQVGNLQSVKEVDHGPVR